MHTLCLRTTLDPNRIAAFRTYVEAETPVIRAAGGHITGYYLPTDFAGPTNIGYGLVPEPARGGRRAVSAHATLIPERRSADLSTVIATAAKRSSREALLPPSRLRRPGVWVASLRSR